MFHNGITRWMFLRSRGDYLFEAKGHECKNEGHLGMSSTLGTGRIGFFFDYLGKEQNTKAKKIIMAQQQMILTPKYKAKPITLILGLFIWANRLEA